MHSSISKLTLLLLPATAGEKGGRANDKRNGPSLRFFFSWLMIRIVERRARCSSRSFGRFCRKEKAESSKARRPQTSPNPSLPSPL